MRRLWHRLSARQRRLLSWAAAALASVWAIAWIVPPPARLGEPPSTVVSFRDGSPIYVFLSPDDKYRMAAELKTLDSDYVEALLRFEDKRFYFHPGVDPIAVVRSIVVNLESGRVLTGASTLTMQLVRVLEPRPRTLLSKAVEAVRAVQLELRMSKREILAAYLTFVPYGRNVEGVRAASWAYFGHGPEALAPEEIATLLAVPQMPAARYPAERNRARLAKARDEIAERLLGEDALPLGEAQKQTPAEVLGQVRAAETPKGFRPLPRHAPHAAFWLKRQLPGETRIETTLDRGAQLTAEKLTRAARGELGHLGIHNGAVVVVDHRSSELRALVGNFDFWDERHGGQIAGFDVARSPGSALKPLIYALAIDRGLALPEHLVPDVPVAYGDYRPDNYDGDFTGLISLEDALSFSLNVPFVRLLSAVGVDGFIGTLEAMGAASLRSEPGYYGLSAAIGSVEIRPLEMAALYATLAQEGGYRPLRWLKSQEETEAATRIFSPGAAWLTRRALARRDRPDFPERRRMSGVPSRIHWKTGTSYGHRDAWAAGSGPDHTAVVWLGNFDNAPSVDLVGAEAAGPLLFDLLEAVADRSRLPEPRHRPADLKRVEVCAYSGHLPAPACQQRAWVDAVAGHVPTARCPYHVEIDVDLATGLALNPGCRSGRQWETRNYVVWPASVRRYLAAGHRWLPSPPALAPGCEAGGERRPPAILTPPPGQILVLMPGLDPSQQEVPLQAETADGAELAWFVDGEFLGKVSAEERMWWTPSEGHHEILVMDEAGRSARRRLEVRRAG